MRFSKFVVILCIATIHLFTAIVLVFAWYGKEVPTQLIVSFFAVVGTEFVALAWIRAVEQKTKKENDQNV